MAQESVDANVNIGSVSRLPYPPGGSLGTPKYCALVPQYSFGTASFTRQNYGVPDQNMVSTVPKSAASRVVPIF